MPDTNIAMFMMMLFCFSLILLQHSSGHNLCENSTLCNNNDSKCCASANGIEWCCPKSKSCCLYENGCCSENLPEKSMEKIYNFTSKPKMLKIYKSFKKIQMFNLNRHQSKNLKYKKCDKEGMFYCPDSETCCEGSSGLWKCCQYQNGTCCVDKENCCPANMICNGSSCSRLKSAINIRNSPLVFCPGRQQVCPETFTCCLNGNDHYGCCPYTDAQCCSDFEHCCPQNTECDVKQKRCLPPSSI